MRIKEAAEHVGYHPATLRVLEKMGVLPKPERGPNGQRDYSPQDVLRIQKLIKERHQGKK